jgi:hypothetical protein
MDDDDMYSPPEYIEEVEEGEEGEDPVLSSAESPLTARITLNTGSLNFPRQLDKTKRVPDVIGDFYNLPVRGHPEYKILLRTACGMLVEPSSADAVLPPVCVPNPDDPMAVVEIIGFHTAFDGRLQMVTARNIVTGQLWGLVIKARTSESLVAPVLTATVTPGSDHKPIVVVSKCGADDLVLTLEKDAVVVGAFVGFLAAAVSEPGPGECHDTALEHVRSWLGWGDSWGGERHSTHCEMESLWKSARHVLRSASVDRRGGKTPSDDTFALQRSRVQFFDPGHVLDSSLLSMCRLLSASALVS